MNMEHTPSNLQLEVSIELVEGDVVGDNLKPLLREWRFSNSEETPAYEYLLRKSLLSAEVIINWMLSETGIDFRVALNKEYENHVQQFL